MLSIQKGKPVVIDKPNISNANNDKINVTLVTAKELRVQWIDSDSKYQDQTIDVDYVNPQKIFINDYDHCLVVMPNSLHSFKLFKSKLTGDVYSARLQINEDILDCQLCDDIVLVRCADKVIILSLSLQQHTDIQIPKLEMAYLVRDQDVFMVCKTSSPKILHYEYPPAKLIESELYKDIPLKPIKCSNGIILSSDGKIFNTEIPSRVYEVSDIVDFCVYQGSIYVLDDKSKITELN